MIVTESDLRAQLRRPSFGARVVVPVQARLSPSAEDFINQWQLVRVAEADEAAAAPADSTTVTAVEAPAPGAAPLADVVYLLPTGPCPELFAVAKALVRQLGGRASVLRPLARHADDDRVTRLLGSQLDDPSRAVVGATLLDALTDENSAMTRIVAEFARLRAGSRPVLLLGSEFDGPTAPIELRLGAEAAANVGATVVLLAPDEEQALVGIGECRRGHAAVGGVLLLTEGRTPLPVPRQLIGVGGAAANTSTFRVDPALLVRPARVATTPLSFERALLDRARAVDRHIVLPEGSEERILRAADRLLAGGICRLTLLGVPDEVRGKARRLGLNIEAADVIDPLESGHRHPFAARYAELRAKKGVTIEQALEKMADVSYFGTMLVREGFADGMVSGAVNTTAHTIRPALEFVKTRPGVSVVSSAFLMCLADRVLVYGDCAVNPNPTPDQLADIAISSAKTAEIFGIEARVAMLAYSTGTSGSGPDVDLVAAATALVRERAPELAVDGPLQYDAAVDPTVAATKMPDSPVAGRATVLIFPNLTAGNICYKAVQRSADALAVGPMLQGLNKPVNDLSRGALVADIVNTVAMTAIQAAQEGA